MAALADVDLTVGARDETGQTLSNIDNRLVDMNKTLEKQFSVFERIEKQYTELVDRIEMSAPTIKGVFDNMHTELTKINKVLRENEKAQRGVNKETAKAGKIGGGGHALNTELYKKTADIEVDVRDDRRKQANRAALAEQDSFNDNLLQKELEGSQQRLSVITQSSQAKTLEEKRGNDKRLNEQQGYLDREFGKLKESNAEKLADLKSYETLSKNFNDQMHKNELSSYDKSTKLSIESVKEKHDKIIAEQKASNKEFSDIRKKSLTDQITDSQTALQNAKAAAQAETQSVINERTNRHERERSINDEFRGKALAALDAEQKKELSQIDSTRTLKIELTKREHNKQTAELTDHLNKKDSELASHYDRDIQQFKNSAESLSSVQDQKHDEEIAETKAFHNAVESASKAHEDELLQIKRHARRVDLEKTSHEREFGRGEMLQRQRAEKAERERVAEKVKQAERERIASMKAERKRLEQVRKDEETVAVRRAKTGAYTATERGDIDLEETLAKQKAAHEQQLAQEKRFADEKVGDFKQSSKEYISAVEAESEKKARIQKQSAQEQMAIAEKQNDRMLGEMKRAQEDELEAIKQIGSEKLTRRETRKKAELDAFHEQRNEIRNALEDSLDEEIMMHKRAADRREATINADTKGSIDRRQKQANNEIKKLAQQKAKEIEVVKSSMSELETENKKQKREELLRLKTQHEQEISLIDVHDKVKIAQKEESLAREISNTKSYFDELFAIERSELEKKLSLLEGGLTIERAREEAGRDKEIADIKAHGDRIIAEEESNNKRSLAELQSHRQKRLAEIEHTTKMEEQKIIQSQRKLSRRISDDIKGSAIGRFFGKANKLFSGFLAADFAMIGVHEIWDFARGLGDALVKMEAMKLSLTAVEGSAEKAYAQLKRIAEIAKLPGVHLESAIKTTVTLRALKLEGQLVERTIIAIGNALATLGRESELGGVTLALSQIIGKGKVHAEEINQIAERLPLIRGVLVEQFGTANTEILQRMDLKINDFIAKITEGLENLPKVATTIGTELKNMKNQWFLFKASLGTLLKPAMMTSIRAWTSVLELANKILDKANEGERQRVIKADKVQRTEGYIEQYQMGTGAHDPTQTRVSELAIEYESARQAFSGTSERLQEIESRIASGDLGYQQLNLQVQKDLTRQYYEQFKQINKISREMAVVNKLIAKHTKNLGDLTSDKIIGILDLLEDEESKLVLKDDVPSQRRLEVIQPIIDGYNELLLKAVQKESGKAGEDAEKQSRLAAAIKKQQEDVLEEILGVGFKSELTEQKILQLKDIAQGGAALKAIDFTVFTDDLESFQIEKEKVIGKQIAALNTQQARYERKAELNKFAAARDLFPDKTKGLKETDEKMIDFASQAQEMQLSRIRDAYDVLRSETRNQIEESFQFELDYQKWRADQEAQLADRLLKLWKNIDIVPKTQEGIMAQITSEVMNLKSIVPEQFRERFSGFSSAQSMAGNVESRLRESSSIATAAETDRPTTFIHKAMYAEMNALAQQYIDVTNKEIDGKQRSLEEIVSHISFLESKLPEFEGFVKERESLHKRIIQLDKDKIKAEVTLAKQGADALKKSPDVVARSVEDIQSVLKTAKLEAMRHEIVGRDDLADPYLKQKARLEKELIAAKKQELKQSRDILKSQLSRQSLDEDFSIDELSEFLQAV